MLGLEGKRFAPHGGHGFFGLQVDPLSLDFAEGFVGFVAGGVIVDLADYFIL